MIQYDQWHGQYKDGWKGHITSSSFSHPAKFSKGLIFHIIQHVIDEGWVIPGKSTCVDPFAGIGGGALPCALQGIQWLGCELESRFVTFANGGECGGDLAKHEACTDTGEHGPHHLPGNLELWQRKYGALPQWKQPVLLQGDSRQLGQILQGYVDSLVASPPYADGCTHTGGADPQPQHIAGGPLRYVQYGADCALVSPPYNSGTVHDSAGIDRSKSTTPGGTRMSRGAPPGGYSAAPENLGNMPPGDVAAVVQGRADLSLASPPHGPEALGHHRGAEADAKEWRTKSIHGTTYSASPQNLGNMKAGDVAAVVQGDCGISSPPYEGSIHPDEHPETKIRRALKAGHTMQSLRNPGGQLRHTFTYGDTPQQLGNTQGTTFWEAARQIVMETFKLLRPGAHAVWVTKHYIRDSQFVDFPGDWRRLTESVGFQTLHIHLAMLVERRVETHLFEGECTYEQWTESFFRRLSRKKTGVGIECETVICQVKPLTTAPLPPDEAWEQLPLLEVDLGVCSPSYGGNEKSDYLLSADGKTRQRDEKRGYVQGHGSFRGSETYGQTEGQLGAMRVGSVDLVLTSPAYGNSLNDEKNGIDWTRADGGTRDRTREANYRSHNGSGITAQHYGTTTGQLGSMPAGEKPA